jgi:phosphonoacetaldehyde hydrolase
MKSPIQAVIFDWAGTLIDFGSRAPVAVVMEVFERSGVPITTAQARGPMGMAKREHLAAVCAMPLVREAWHQRYGRWPDQQDVDALYADFLPLQRSLLARHCDAIPGAIEALAFLADRQIAVGSTTGYTRELMEVVLPLAASQGIAPQVVVAADDVRSGRPKPWLIYEAMQRLDRYPAWHCLVVDDTLVGLDAGIQAGCWTVGVSRSGNELGMSRMELDRAEPSDIAERLLGIERRFIDVGVDFVIGSVADLPQVLLEVERRIAAGGLPRGLSGQRAS